MSKDITLTVDYHDRVCVIRWFHHGTGRDQVFTEVPLRNLAVLAGDRGDQSAPVECWTRVLAERPGDAEASARLNGFGSSRDL